MCPAPLALEASGIHGEGTCDGKLDHHASKWAIRTDVASGNISPRDAHSSGSSFTDGPGLPASMALDWVGVPGADQAILEQELVGAYEHITGIIQSALANGYELNRLQRTVIEDQLRQSRWALIQAKNWSDEDKLSRLVKQACRASTPSRPHPTPAVTFPPTGTSS